MFKVGNTGKKSTELLWNIRAISQRTDDILETVKDYKGKKDKQTDKILELAAMNRNLVAMLEDYGKKLDLNGEKLDELRAEMIKLLDHYEGGLGNRIRNFFSKLYDSMKNISFETPKVEEQKLLMAKIGLFNFLQ